MNDLTGPSRHLGGVPLHGTASTMAAATTVITYTNVDTRNYPSICSHTTGGCTTIVVITTLIITTTSPVPGPAGRRRHYGRALRPVRRRHLDGRSVPVFQWVQEVHRARGCVTVPPATPQQSQQQHQR